MHELWTFYWKTLGVPVGVTNTMAGKKTVGGRHAYRSQVLSLLQLTQFDIVLIAIALLHFREFGVI